MATPTAKNCVKVLRGRVARITRLDDCGRPLLGKCSTVVTSGVIELKITPEIEAGDEIKVKTFDGALCISEKSCDQVKWWTTELTMCSVDPDVMSIVNPSYQPVLSPLDGSTIGYMDNTVLECNAGFALEVWMQAIGTINPCSQPLYTGVKGQYWYYCLPYVIGGAPADIDLKNDAVSFVYKGRTKSNSAWGVGPYPVLLTKLGTPSGGPADAVCGPLPMPVPPSAQVVQFLTTMSPPVAECGCQDTTPAATFTATLPAPSGTGKLTIAAGTNNITGGTTATATVDWGDGTKPDVVNLTLSGGSTTTCNPMGPLPTYNGATPAHTYKCAGVYQVVVSDGGTTSMSQVTAGDVLAGTATATKSSNTAIITALTNLKAPIYTVDWKDGSAPQTYQAVQDSNGCYQVATSGVQEPTHTYAGSWSSSTPTSVTVSATPDTGISVTLPWA